MERLDPARLLVDLNVRQDTRVDKDFIASIRDHGVLVPVIAVRTSESQIRVRFGHRRVLAAIESGLAAVPVPRRGAGWSSPSAALAPRGASVLSGRD